MTTRRTASSSLSSQVIAYLRQQGKSQTQIARMLHVSDGFISLVKNKERSLTLDHLELLASTLGLPLGEMLLAVTSPKGSKRSAAYVRTARLMKTFDAATDANMRSTKARSRRSA